jgi:hypothetical protein
MRSDAGHFFYVPEAAVTLGRLLRCAGNNLALFFSSRRSYFMSRYILAAALALVSILAAGSAAVAAGPSPAPEGSLPAAGGCGVAAVAGVSSAIESACRPMSGPKGPILFDGKLGRFAHYC